MRNTLFTALAGDSPYIEASRAIGAHGPINYSLQGPPVGHLVLCFHGLNASLAQFEPIGRLLSSRGFRVLSFDLWGHGLSGQPKRHTKYEPPLFVAQARELLVFLSLGQTIHSVLGFSMGGLLAVWYANTYKELISKVILLSPAGLAKSKPRKISVLFEGPVSKLTVPLIKGIWAIIGATNFHNRSQVTRTHANQRSYKLVYCTHPGHDWRCCYNRNLNTVMNVIKGMPLWSGQQDYEHLLGALFPVFIAWGEDDNVFPTKDSHQSLLDILNTLSEPDWLQNDYSLNQASCCSWPSVKSSTQQSQQGSTPPSSFFSANETPQIDYLCTIYNKSAHHLLADRFSDVSTDIVAFLQDLPMNAAKSDLHREYPPGTSRVQAISTPTAFDLPLKPYIHLSSNQTKQVLGSDVHNCSFQSATASIMDTAEWCGNYCLGLAQITRTATGSSSVSSDRYRSENSHDHQISSTSLLKFPVLRRSRSAVLLESSLVNSNLSLLTQSRNPAFSIPGEAKNLTKQIDRLPALPHELIKEATNTRIRDISIFDSSISIDWMTTSSDSDSSRYVFHFQDKTRMFSDVNASKHFLEGHSLFGRNNDSHYSLLERSELTQTLGCCSTSRAARDYLASLKRCEIIRVDQSKSHSSSKSRKLPYLHEG